MRCVMEKYKVEKYKSGRNWAVYVDDILLAVTVYKKGALAIVEALESKWQKSGVS